MDNDAVSRMKKLAFVKSQLQSYPGEKKPGPNDSTFILCPFHNEKTPSGRVFHSNTTRSPGYFRCYGCGTHCSWDTLAVKLGLRPWRRVKPSDEYAAAIPMVSTEEDAEKQGRGRLVLGRPLPRDKVWRSLPTNFLIKLGARFCTMYYPDSDYTTEDFIYLPCHVRGSLKGFIRARLRKEPEKPSYLNKPGPWSHIYGLFPYDYAISLMENTTGNTIVLVEGPRDALRLCHLGIPTMCILGTHSWSPAKSRVLELGGVDNVMLFMDGDKAGRLATEELESALQLLFNVQSMRLPMDENKWDPGNCPLWMLDKLKRRIRCK